MSVVTKKPVFSRDQLVPASSVVKNFSDIRSRAKHLPLFVTDNGVVDTVVMSYEQFERMYMRLVELEEAQEEEVLEARLKEIMADPSLGVPWDDPEAGFRE